MHDDSLPTQHTVWESRHGILYFDDALRGMFGMNWEKRARATGFVLFAQYENKSQFGEGHDYTKRWLS